VDCCHPGTACPEATGLAKRFDRCGTGGVGAIPAGSLGSRPPSARAIANIGLLADVRRIQTRRHGRYGSPRMHAVLRAEGRKYTRGRVERPMRRYRIRVLAGRQFRPCITDTRHYLPIAPNLLAQRFVAPAPNRIWLADITYIAIGEGWLYLAAVLELATRKIVGWALRDNMRTELPLAALIMVAQRQRPAPGLVHHSDRGSQYTAGGYVDHLAGGDPAGGDDVRQISAVAEERRGSAGRTRDRHLP